MAGRKHGVLLANTKVGEVHMVKDNYQYRPKGSQKTAWGPLLPSIRDVEIQLSGLEDREIETMTFLSANPYASPGRLTQRHLNSIQLLVPLGLVASEEGAYYLTVRGHLHLKLFQDGE